MEGAKEGKAREKYLGREAKGGKLVERGSMDRSQDIEGNQGNEVQAEGETMPRAIMNGERARMLREGGRGRKVKGHIWRGRKGDTEARS